MEDLRSDMYIFRRLFSLRIATRAKAQRKELDLGINKPRNAARVPITAERPPDFTDLSDLIDLMVRNSASRAPIVINCQLGRGRSTMTAVGLFFVSGR